MSTETLKQKDCSCVASNKSQFTQHEDDGEGVLGPLPKDGPVKATPVTSHKNASTTNGIENQPMRCSQVQAISIVVVVTAIILAVGVSVPVVFYYVFVGQVCSS